MSKLQYSKGFTLIEVLVASLILFSVLATVSMVYRGAITSSTKATQHLKINASVTPLLSQIEREIHQTSKGNEETIDVNGNFNGVSYSWNANLVEFKAAPDRFDADTGNFVSPPKKYKLWHVKLKLSLASTSKEFSFYQLGWNDA